MKKLLALLMALVFVFSFAACDSKDKDNDKDEKKTVASETDAPATDAPISTKDAEKAVDNFFYNLDTKALLKLMGEDTNNLGSDGELYVVIFDSIILNSTYQILGSENKDAKTVDVSVKLAVPDTEAAINLIMEAAAILDEEYPDATEEEGLEMAKELFKQGFADRSIEKIPTEIVVTTNLVNGEWVVDTSDEFVAELVDIFFAALENM